MNSKLQIRGIAASDKNEKTGLYQFIITLGEGAKGRAFFKKDPEWKMTAVTRLLNVPCPICHKDYYCNCLEKNAEMIERQIIDQDLISSVLD